VPTLIAVFVDGPFQHPARMAADIVGGVGRVLNLCVLHDLPLGLYLFGCCSNLAEICPLHSLLVNHNLRMCEEPGGADAFG